MMKPKAPIRHAAEVTADRLSRHVDCWPTAFNQIEREYIRVICDRLAVIAADPFTYPSTGRRRRLSPSEEGRP